MPSHPLVLLIPDAAHERRLAAARREAGELEPTRVEPVPAATREQMTTAPAGPSKG